MSSENYHFYQQDSLYTGRQADTIHPQDLQVQGTEQEPVNSAMGFFPEDLSGLLRQQAAALTFQPEMITGTPVQEDRQDQEKREGWNSGRNFFLENGLSGILKENRNGKSEIITSVGFGTVKPENIQVKIRSLTTIDWFLGIFLMITVLFIWIRLYYSKFFATLGNALLSFQISAKMFREKNVLLHRVSMVLDFIYILVISVFLFELSMYFRIVGSVTSRFNLFLIFLNFIILYTLVRIFILRLTGFLFMAQPLFSEYLHNTFLINKGVGIALFPVIIMAHYLPFRMILLVLIAGLTIIVAAFIFKSMRAYQIIIRKDVLIFYLILYLCTLEILPLLLGYKVVISLI